MNYHHGLVRCPEQPHGAAGQSLVVKPRRGPRFPLSAEVAETGTLAAC